MHPRPIEAIAGFAQHLRDHGFRVGIAEQQAMVQAAMTVSPDRYRDLQAGWRGIVCSGAADWRHYPELFGLYWFPDAMRGNVRTSGATRPRRDLRELVEALRSAGGAEQRPGTSKAGGVARGDAAAQADEADPTRAQGGASRTEPLERRDFGEWLPQDLDRLQRIVEDVARRMRRRLTRRLQADSHGRRLDIRRTLRASLRTGGVPFEPAWSTRRRERPRFFILVDVSRSMELYAQLFLRVARAFVEVLGARVFVFHTRLAEVTPLLRRTSGRVQEKVNAVTAGFGGGTRIATSVADFAQVHARGALTRSSRVIVMSDGYDTDREDELAGALQAIRARGARIYWLHPSRDLPQASALAPCGASIEAFAPAHDLASLEALPDLIH